VTALDDVPEAEPSGDQRCVGLDVGTHHEDVARLERRVVLKQAEQHLAEHVDLARGPVTGVHLDRPVPGGERAAFRAYGVGRQVGLEPPQQGLRERRPLEKANQISLKPQRTSGIMAGLPERNRISGEIPWHEFAK